MVVWEVDSVGKLNCTDLPGLVFGVAKDRTVSMTCRQRATVEEMAGSLEAGTFPDACAMSVLRSGGCPGYRFGGGPGGGPGGAARLGGGPGGGPGGFLEAPSL